jgi:hypothetical protein
MPDAQVVSSKKMANSLLSHDALIRNVLRRVSARTAFVLIKNSYFFIDMMFLNNKFFILYL